MVAGSFWATKRPITKTSESPLDRKIFEYFSAACIESKTTECQLWCDHSEAPELARFFHYNNVASQEAPCVTNESKRNLPLLVLLDRGKRKALLWWDSDEEIPSTVLVTVALS